MAVTYALATPMTYAAGANVNSTYTAAAYLLEFGLQAEAFINSASGFDWSAWYTSYAASYPHVERILVHAASCFGALQIINCDMSGFINIQEAVSRQNLLYTNMMNDITMLMDEKVKDFINRGGA